MGRTGSTDRCFMSNMTTERNQVAPEVGPKRSLKLRARPLRRHRQTGRTVPVVIGNACGPLTLRVVLPAGLDLSARVHFGGDEMHVIDLGTGRIAVEITHEDEFSSEHSGKSLRMLRGTFDGDQADHDLLQDAISSQGFEGLKVTSPRGDVDSYLISIPSHRLYGGHSTYTVELKEAENLQPEALVIDGEEFHPTRYKEEVHQGELIVHAVVTATRERHDALRDHVDKRDFFPVIRRGIRDTPVNLRFGLCAWSEHEGTFKHRLIMLDGKFDEGRRGRHITDAQRANRHTMVAYDSAYLIELTQLLVDKNLINAEDVQGLKDRAKSATQGRIDMWLRVRDVDDLEWEK
jgi:hypothetical protein